MSEMNDTQPVIPEATTDIAPPVPTVGATAHSRAPERPRVRWAGIIWGVVLAAIAGGILAILLSTALQHVLLDLIFTIDPMTIAILIVLLIGVLALITGLVVAAGRAQRRKRA